MATSSSASSHRPNAIERVASFMWGGVRFVFMSTIFLLSGVILSIIVEWIGMNYLWEEEGSLHARNMLYSEIEFLEEDFSRQILGLSPRSLSQQAAVATAVWLRPGPTWGGFLASLKNPLYHTDNTAMEYGKRMMKSSEKYINSAHDIIVLYVVRMVIIFLSLPLILIVAFAWTIDGLCQRELRKDGGGRESTTKFHLINKYLARSNTSITLNIY